jgi:hypothetical protein
VLPRKINLLHIIRVADGPKADIAVLQGGRGASALLGYSDICDLPLNFHPVAIRALADVSVIGSGIIGWKGFERMVANNPTG